MERRHVVITGMGVVSPAGHNVAETWDAVVNGKSSVRSIRRFDPVGATKVAAPVPGYDEPIADDQSLAATFGAIAVGEAIDDAGLSPDMRPGLAFVSHHGERVMHAPNGRHAVYGADELVQLIGRVAGADRTATVYGACAGGGLALGLAYDFVRSGGADLVIAGGVDCLLREMDYMQFANLYAMSTRDCPPTEASCPFDRRRDGFVMAEGAAFLVVEAAEHAARRGARPRAVIEGFGCSQSAYDLIASPPDARGPALALQAALADAGVSPDSVDYINAHGTSTRDNDWCETMAIRECFGKRAEDIPVSSSKSVLGHTMGAAGAIEAALSVRALEENLIPPTINLDEPDPMCNLDYVPWSPRPAELRRVVSNSFGFGGTNAVLLLGQAS